MDINEGLKALEEQREALNRIDDGLAALLLERWTVVEAVGDIKAAYELSTFDPDREAQILDRVTAMASTEEQAEALKAVFNAILIASKVLQQKDRL